ncbi:MAG: hypothetical protein LBF95_07825 [Treponema sp.]|jgi:hypothetical protein|nr:hypothetical protein [Treponema sp.]
MTIEQTVEIPANHRLTLDVPREIPTGRAILAFTPVSPALRSVDKPARMGFLKDRVSVPADADLRSDDTMLMSEASLAGDWNTPEEDAAWGDL